MKLSPLMSSKSNEWATPQQWFDYLNLEFKFTLDPCADESNAKCKKFFTVQDDGLSKSWARERIFLNPPYGRQIGHWLKKAYTECVENHALVVCLVPARVDTKWWHDYATKASDIRFPMGRLKFGNAVAPAPFPVAIVIFRPRVDR